MSDMPVKRSQYVADALLDALRMHADGESKTDVLCHLLHAAILATQSQSAAIVELSRQNDHNVFVHCVNQLYNETFDTSPTVMKDIKRLSPFRFDKSRDNDRSLHLRLPNNKRKQRRWSFRSFRNVRSSLSIPNNLGDDDQTFRVYATTMDRLPAMYQSLLMDKRAQIQQDDAIGTTICSRHGPILGCIALHDKHTNGPYDAHDRRHLKDVAAAVENGLSLYRYEMCERSADLEDRLSRQVVHTMSMPLVVFDFQNALDAESAVIDPSLMICTYANHAFCSLTGFELSECPDQRYQDERNNPFIHFLTADPILSCIQCTMISRKRKTSWATISGDDLLHHSCEHRCKQTPSGAYVIDHFEYGDDLIPLSHYEVHIYRVNCTRLGIVLHDITEKIEHERLIEQASRAKTEFLASINHEFRTPLNGIDGNLQLLLQTAPLSDRQLDLMHRMRISTTALMSLLQEVLDYAKLEQHKIQLNESVFSVRHVIQAAFDVLSGCANQKRLELTYNMDLDVPPMVVGDSFRLQQVLVNLVSNSIKFTEHGSVHVGVRVMEDMLRFDVRDTGQGVDAENRERLFLPWVQLGAPNRRHQRGTGLGLAICRQLVQLMGGHIWLDQSELGQGSTFAFEIPCHADDSPDVDKDAERNASAKRILGKRAILIVDDNEENRRMLTRTVFEWGMRPTSCASGAEAVDFLSAGYEFGVALVDIRMPGMDGNQLAEWIHVNRPHMPMIALSSDDPSTQVSEYFTKSLYKPIQLARLRSIVCNLFENMEDHKYIHAGATAKKSVAKQTRILVVEDVEENQKVLVDMLHVLGYEMVDVCENGQQMLERVQANNAGYDVILLDLLMPVMNGLEAMEIYRNNGQHPLGQPPYVVAVTATSMLDEDPVTYRAAGMDAFIAKPIKMKELRTLLDVIDEQLAKAKERTTK